jgi:glutamate dehydrogenase/leucine dehydrogenase
VPDILANAVGVVVSYFEWVQNTENQQWDLAEVNDRLQRRMVRATESVLEKWAELERDPPVVSDTSATTPKPSTASPVSPEPVSLRTAAYVVAISRVASVALERGIWP